MRINRRRSDRLMLTIPLRVLGSDPNGLAFKEEARTVTLNRHGARIQTSRRLSSGQVVRLVNLVSKREAEFRVVGPVSPVTDKGGEWGVECVSATDNIWGIQFPPPREGQSVESTALLECRRCHAVALMHLSLVEVEVLQTSGILSKPCQSCEAASPWGYAEKPLAMSAPPGEEAMLAEGQAAARGVDQRWHRRVSLQLPVRIRDYYGAVEITKSENVSKGGFCFASEKNYLLGQGIVAVCPYNPAASTIEVRARVVRRQDLEGTSRKIYGLRYTPQED
jgi:hypothetical protein